MESIKNVIIKFKSDNKFKFFLWNIQRVVSDLVLFTIKSFIACSMFFLFLSIFTFNLQVQHHESNGNLKDYTSIIQVDELYSNLHAYFLEDCPFICIPSKY